VLPETGHLIPKTAPDAVAAAIGRFHRESRGLRPRPPEWARAQPPPRASQCPDQLMTNQFAGKRCAGRQSHGTCGRLPA
jgi:hypothetical protein